MNLKHIETYQATDIINFWYSARVKKLWFTSPMQFDLEIREKFEQLWNQAVMGGLDSWTNNAIGCLALTIILDQFPLNMFRGQAKSYCSEGLAIKITKIALAQQLDSQLSRQQKVFLYMPLMHSENLNDQDLAIKLFEQQGLESNLRFARHHRSIIQRFGRFPHRNQLLNRNTREQEKTYLQSKQAFFG